MRETVPECYLCGAYIQPGRGHRRNIETGTSVRYYMDRHGGTSYGVRYGLRTLCHICAKIHDRSREGRAARAALYAIGWGLSAFLGWQMLGQAEGPGGKLFGIGFLLGLPVFILGFIAEQQRSQEIAGEVRAFADEDVSDGPAEASLTRTAQEEADALAARQTNAEMTSALGLPAFGLLAIIGCLLIFVMFNQ